MIAAAAIAPMQWHARDRVLDLSRPMVMGILNVTPDSFNDGGRYVGLDATLARAEEMANEGADIVDVGGESTRPGSARVTEDEELRRVVPVIEGICKRLSVVISVDTMKAGVARAALAAGAHMVNDVRALQNEGMAEAVAASGAGVVLMHMHGTPETMQDDPLDTEAVVETVVSWLAERVAAVERMGIGRELIAIDPGIGFGKTASANEILIARLGDFKVLGLPIVVGASRKQFIGLRTGRDTHGRLAGSIAAHVLAFANGARVIRTHDVQATRDALAVAAEITERGIVR